MTLSRFIRELQRLEAAGHGRKPVTANARELLDWHNGCYEIVRVHSVGLQRVPIADGDGAPDYRADGTERAEMQIVIE